MQIGFYIDQTRCTGCFTCIVACKDWNDVPAGSASWMRVTTLERGRYPDTFVAFFPTPCFHCDKPLCVDACPVNAIFKRKEDGIVLIDQGKCLGKESCSMFCKEACPYGAPQFRDEKNTKMEKCNFCVERWGKGQKPICVEACRTYALDAGPIDQLVNKYGDIREAEGFIYSTEACPSIVLKPKRKAEAENIDSAGGSNGYGRKK
jgi:anaerobic dimethyl sulfoxide reductase subunit B (iron-sulfur subunit)